MKFSIKTTIQIGIQLLQNIKIIHDRGIIHRNITPENICIGLNENKKKVYFIDFDSAKPYLDDNGRHSEFRCKDKLRGNPIFISMNAHQSYELSRRDDLESLMYLLIYLHKGQLPWNENKYQLREEIFASIEI